MGLIPHLQDVIVMFSLEQKGKLNFSTFRFDDALHLFGGIPDWHIASTSARSAARRRRADVHEQFLGLSRKTQTAKIGVECCAIKLVNDPKSEQVLTTE